jgi:type 1 glutamine amidotransferase
MVGMAGFDDAALKQGLLDYVHKGGGVVGSHAATDCFYTKTDMTKNGIKRADNDFGVSWVHKYGKGRVFYCSLGHREETYWNPVMLKYYLSGIQFATGDLKADASPRPESKP